MHILAVVVAHGWWAVLVAVALVAGVVSAGGDQR